MMPRLKEAMESALGIVEKKKAPPPPEERSSVKDHIASVLGRHAGLPTELVERFYKCASKAEVKRLLREWLGRQPSAG